MIIELIVCETRFSGPYRLFQHLLLQPSEKKEYKSIPRIGITLIEQCAMQIFL